MGRNLKVERETLRFGLIRNQERNNKGYKTEKAPTTKSYVGVKNNKIFFKT